MASFFTIIFWQWLHQGLRNLRCKNRTSPIYMKGDTRAGKLHRRCSLNALCIVACPTCSGSEVVRRVASRLPWPHGYGPGQTRLNQADLQGTWMIGLDGSSAQPEWNSSSKIWKKHIKLKTGLPRGWPVRTEPTAFYRAATVWAKNFVQGNPSYMLSDQAHRTRSHSRCAWVKTTHQSGEQLF